MAKSTSCNRLCTPAPIRWKAQPAAAQTDFSGPGLPWFCAHQRCRLLLFVHLLQAAQHAPPQCKLLTVLMLAGSNLCITSSLHLRQTGLRPQVLTAFVPQIMTVALPVGGRAPIPYPQPASDLRGSRALPSVSRLGVEASGLCSKSAGRIAVPTVCGPPFTRPLPASGG